MLATPLLVRLGDHARIVATLPTACHNTAIGWLAPGTHRTACNAFGRLNDSNVVEGRLRARMTVIRVATVRCGGGLLGQTIKQGQAEGWIATHGGDRKSTSDGLTLMSDIVPNKVYAHRCYKLADLPEDVIDLPAFRSSRISGASRARRARR